MYTMITTGKIYTIDDMLQFLYKIIPVIKHIIVSTSTFTVQFISITSFAAHCSKIPE